MPTSAHRRKLHVLLSLINLVILSMNESSAAPQRTKLRASYGRLTYFLILFALGLTREASAADSPTTTRSLASARAPAFPNPATWQGTPVQQAQAAATAFASPKPSIRMAALLAALGATGVPVIGPEGRVIVGGGSDFLGLPWIHLSGVAISNPSFSISLADAARLLDVGKRPIAAADPAIASTFLATVREGLSSADPRVQFFSHLISESNTRLRGPAITLTSTTADQVRVDMATLEVIVGRVFRLTVINAFLKGAKERTTSSGSDAIFQKAMFIRTSQATIERGDRPLLAPQSPPIDCSEEGLNSWGIWILSKAAGGVDMSAIGGESAAWKGLSDWVTRRIVDSGTKITVDPARLSQAVDNLGRLSNWLTNVMSALNYVFELAMLHGTVRMEGGEPLVRNKRKSDGHGQAKKLVAKVEMKLPDSIRGDSDPKTDATVVNALNCILGLGAAFGNNTFMPTEGPKKGLRVTTVGGKGFTQSLDAGNSIVLFGPQTFEPNQDTDENGEIRIPVQGRQQKRDYPDTAKPVKKEFSVILSSTLEPTGGSSIAKTFLDSLICMGKPGMGCTDAMTDVLKTFRYSLGEHTFAVTDWGTEYVLEIHGRGRLKAAAWSSMAVEKLGSIRLKPNDSSSGTIAYEGEGALQFDLTPSERCNQIEESHGKELVKVTGDIRDLDSASLTVIISGADLQGTLQNCYCSTGRCLPPLSKNGVGLTWLLLVHGMESSGSTGSAGGLIKLTQWEKLSDDAVKLEREFTSCKGQPSSTLCNYTVKYVLKVAPN